MTVSGVARFADGVVTIEDSGGVGIMLDFRGTGHPGCCTTQPRHNSENPEKSGMIFSMLQATPAREGLLHYTLAFQLGQHGCQDLHGKYEAVIWTSRQCAFIHSCND